jgi:hypothetical protein
MRQQKPKNLRIDTQKARLLMSQANMTPKKVADISGLGYSTVGKVVSNAHPVFECKRLVGVAFSTAVNCEIDDLKVIETIHQVEVEPERDADLDRYKSATDYMMKYLGVEWSDIHGEGGAS